jgi:hypothetical protein
MIVRGLMGRPSVLADQVMGKGVVRLGRCMTWRGIGFCFVLGACNVPVMAIFLASMTFFLTSTTFGACSVFAFVTLPPSSLTYLAAPPDPPTLEAPLCLAATSS